MPTSERLFDLFWTPQPRKQTHAVTDDTTGHLYDLYWSPESRKIAEVLAHSEREARAQAPQPYRRYRGEIAAIPVVTVPTCYVYYAADGTQSIGIDPVPPRLDALPPDRPSLTYRGTRYIVRQIIDHRPRPTAG